MKKIIKPAITEKSKYYCDKHPDKECYSETTISAWYGSEFDLTELKLHLCDDCLKKFYKYIKNKFKVTPTLKEIIF